MFIDIKNIKTNYICEGSGETIILLHGWGANIKLFDTMIKHLSKNFRVIALDMAGFGETEEPDCAWCVDDYVDYILEFLEKLDIKKAIFLAHSFGGRVMIKMLSRKNCPVKCSKLILTGSAGIMPKKSFKSKIKTRIYKVGKGFLNLPPVKKMFPNALENMRRKNGSTDYNSATPIMRGTLVKTVNENLTSLLPLINTETLLIWGENDNAAPLSDGKKFEQLIPNAGLAIIKNAGHFAFLDQWYTFSKILDSFLNIS